MLQYFFPLYLKLSPTGHDDATGISELVFREWIELHSRFTVNVGDLS